MSFLTNDLFYFSFFSSHTFLCLTFPTSIFILLCEILLTFFVFYFLPRTRIRVNFLVARAFWRVFITLFSLKDFPTFLFPELDKFPLSLSLSLFLVFPSPYSIFFNAKLGDFYSKSRRNFFGHTTSKE